jgi:hypothetical protein
VRLFNDGYGIGLTWIRDHPGAFVRLAARKLWIFWKGAATGLTGFNLPLGTTGTRRAVDMLSVDGALAAAWAAAWAVLCAAGLWTARGRPAVTPWLLLLGSKVLVTVAFFGYARQGAAVVPAVLVLAALAAEPWLAREGPRPQAWVRGAVAACAVFAAVEGVRAVQGPSIVLDGRRVGAVDPVPPDQHRDHTLDVR